MIDILKDIVKHTHGLGFLDLVKVTGDSNETAIDSMAEDRSVILQGSFHKPQSEMVGTFGMPQLNKLDIHLKCPEYKDKAKINVLNGTRNGAEVPTGIFGVVINKQTIRPKIRKKIKYNIVFCQPASIKEYLTIKGDTK